MSVDLFDQVPPLFPLEFFSVRASMHYVKTLPSLKSVRKSYALPETCEFLGEEKFADVALCWSEEGLHCLAFVDKPLEEVEFPLFSKGDALELFIDTRDLKTAGFATRFCHHFLVLPQEVQGIHAQEMTRFRTEDVHPLCDSSDLVVSTTVQRDAYTVHLFIPAHCLHGFDPSSCDRIGFTYKVHRYGGLPQHFAVSSDHFSVEQSPRLWASVSMVKIKK